MTTDNTAADDPTQPKHYTQFPVQPFDLILAVGMGEDFCAGNVIKYVSRYKKKNGLEDLKKARWYLDRLIHQLGQAEQTST